MQKQESINLKKIIYTKSPREIILEMKKLYNKYRYMDISNHPTIMEGINKLKEKGYYVDFYRNIYFDVEDSLKLFINNYDKKSIYDILQKIKQCNIYVDPKLIREAEEIYNS